MNKVGIILLLISIFPTFMTNISNASELTILRGNEDYPPDEMHIDGKLTGFHIELIQNAAKSIPLTVKFESVPWKRAIQMLKFGKADALSYVSRNSSRENYAIFLNDNILTESHYHFIINSQRKEKISYQGKLKDLSPYRIGVQRGYAYTEEFNQASFIHKTIFNSVIQMTSLIRSNRIDLAILTKAEYIAQKDDIIFNQIEILSPAAFSNISYLAFSKIKNINKTAELFAKAMKDYKASDNYKTLKNKYNK
ncbi:MAG: transporter substrate-binding domain-containing protein [Oleispira sp.]